MIQSMYESIGEEDEQNEFGGDVYVDETDEDINAVQMPGSRIQLQTLVGNKTKETSNGTPSGEVKAGVYGRIADLPILISPWVIGERAKGVDVFEVAENDDNVRMLPPELHVAQESNLDACTLEKLIQRLTQEKFPDPRLLTTVLQMYRYYTTPSELLELLILRYTTPCPRNEPFENWRKTKQLPIQLRVVNVIKQWLTDWNSDFKDNKQLLTRLKSFIEESVQNKSLLKVAADQLNRVIIVKVEGTEPDPDATKVQFTETPPPSYLPKVGKTLKLSDIRPIEFARQMTLMEYDLFKKINPSECLNQAWTKPTRNITSPNICAVVDRFNIMSSWVSTEILRPESPKQRAAILQNFISIAEECRILQNLNGVMEIMAGLQNAAITRLKATWEILSHKSRPILDSLKQLISSDDNFSNYRKTFKSLLPPCIPYLGLSLRDLTFYEDGNPDLLPGTRLINFRKLRFVANIFLDIQQSQQAPFCLRPVEQIQNFILSLKPLTEKELYQLSLQREKRITKQKAADALS